MSRVQQKGKRSRPPQVPPRVVRPAQERASSKSSDSAVKQTPSSSRSTSAIKLKSLKREKQQSADIRVANKPVLPKIRSMTQRFDDLIAGQLTDLPDKPPSEVRIFLSSTFSDMRTERNWVMREVYGQLRAHCSAELGLDFSLVDMRWGVTDEATNEHITEQLCLAEIQNCRRVGLGPNFVSILGDRYGYRPIPWHIGAEEFGVLLHEALVFDHSKVELLKSWYVKDDNACPPVYVLQPISSRIPGFGEQAREAVGRAAREQWWQVRDVLQGVLRTAVDAAHSKGLVTAQRRHDYYKSVTEFEIEEGLVKAKAPDETCLCFVRKFVGLDALALKSNPASAERFIEAKAQHGQRTVDAEAERMRAQLQTKTLPQHLSKERLMQYEIPWQPEGVAPEKYARHEAYVRALCGDLVTGLVTQLSAARHALDTHIPASEYYTAYDELLHHLHFCRLKVAHFCGRSDVLHQVRERLTDPRLTAPLVLHGESGAGKTSLMASIFLHLPQWLGPHTFRCIRFLGTSPMSTNIYDVLFSVAGQLADNYDRIMEPVGYKNMRALTKYLPRFIRNLSRTTKEHIVIMLDSIDQLSPLYDAYTMKWLMSGLPHNVHVIVSTLPRLHGILESTRALGLSDACFVEVRALGESTGRQMIDTHLRSQHRILTAQQAALLQSAAKRVPNPLYVKLLVDRALKWRSYTPTADVILPDSVRSAISLLFQELETRFGSVFISHTLGYITVGLNGLSEVELEDVLSCDDAVLDALYQYHNPPVEGVIRVPPVLWARVRYELREYLAERKTHGKNTLSWYHRQFTEVATERYVEGGEATALHRGLAEYYMAEEGIVKDITLSHRKLTLPDADRQVTPNPLLPSNTRVLMTLPYHLRHTRDVTQLKLAALTNLRFLITKIEALGVGAVLKDLEEARVSGLQDADLRAVQDSLQDMRSSLACSEQVPGELLARLPHGAHLSCTATLVSDCRNHLHNQSAPALLPLYPCLPHAAVIVETTRHVTRLLHAHAHVLLCARHQTHRQHLAVFDYSQLAAHTVFTDNLQDYILPQLSKDGNLLSHMRNMSAQMNDLSMLCFETTLCQLSVSDKDSGPVREVLLSPRVDLSGHPAPCGIESHLPVVCYDVTLDNSLVLCCYAHAYLAVHNMEDGSVAALYRIVPKSALTAPSPEHVVVQGVQPVVCTCHLVNAHAQVVSLIHSVTQSDSGQSDTWTTLDVHHVLTNTCHTIQIPGCALVNKWSFTRDEKHFIVPVTDAGGLTRLVTCHLEQGRSQSLKISEAVLDVALSSAHELLGFVLLQGHAVHVYDLMTQKRVTTLRVHEPLTCLAVETDAEHVYAGTCTGHVHVWSAPTWTHRGRFDMGSNGCEIRALVLTGEDDQVHVHSADDTLRSVHVHSLLNNCQAVPEDNQADIECETPLRELSDTCVMLVHSSNQNNELLTCTNSGHLITWNLETLEVENKMKLSDQEFTPKSVVWSSTNHAIFFSSSKAVLIDLVDQSVINSFMFSDEKTLLSMTSDGLGVAYGLIQSKKKLSVLVIDMKTGRVQQELQIKETVNSDSVEIMLTRNTKYLVLKVLCGEKELALLLKAERSLVQGGGLAASAGEYKLLALDLVNYTGRLIPCYRHMTSIVCLVECAEPYIDSQLLLARSRVTTVWDIESKVNDQRLVKGTKIAGFFRPEWIEQWGKNWRQLCHGRQTALHYQPVATGDCASAGVCACGSEDGWLMLYDAQGRCIIDGLTNTPNNPTAVESVCVSASGAWVASCTANHVLKCWSVRMRGQQVFSLKLNLKVLRMEFSADDVILVLLGQRSDGSTRVLVFQVLAHT